MSLAQPKHADIEVPGALSRDIAFDDRDFQKIRALIYKRAGIVIAEHKRDMVYGRVARRIRELHLTSFSAYLQRLDQDVASLEWEVFTNSLTTNLTSFFREAHHFPLLAEHVAARRGPVRVWSAAASTGQEPYSIAMLLIEELGDMADVRVVATDVDTRALEIARSGIYPLKQIEAIDETRRKHFFKRGNGRNNGYARMDSKIATRVEFSKLNLVEDTWPLTGLFDAIFCRNVMIYFDADTQRRVLSHMARYLKPDGLLFAGHSENFTYVSDRFKLRGHTVYTLA
ncbi:MAG TPA: CheR family methyltransferase [Oleiagrimonas sp.]|nr:CheR family methyltransferase [Oleiagrimonas sp.]